MSGEGVESLADSRHAVPPDRCCVAPLRLELGCLSDILQNMSCAPTIDGELLRGISWFAAMGERDRQLMTAAFETRSYSAQQHVFWIGERGEEMFVVQSGQIRLYCPDEAGAEITLALLGPGALFGELSLLDGGPRTASACALSDCVLLVLSRSEFYSFLKTTPAATVELVRVLGQRLRMTTTRLRGIRNANEEVRARSTPLQRLVDRAVAFVASVGFLLGNVIFIVGWLLFHTLRHPGPINLRDDPPTFFWLGFMITLEAILLTIFVLNNQRREAERDRIRADLEYQVNLKAHLEIMQLHEKIDRLLTHHRDSVS